jgi:hypothetical protein
MLNQTAICQSDIGKCNYGENGAGNNLARALNVILLCDLDMKEIGGGLGIPSMATVEYISKVMKN